MNLRIKRISAGRYRYGPYEIVNSAKGRWELWIDGGGKVRGDSIVDVYRTYAEAKADAIADEGDAIRMSTSVHAFSAGSTDVR